MSFSRQFNLFSKILHMLIFYLFIFFFPTKNSSKRGKKDERRCGSTQSSQRMLDSALPLLHIPSSTCVTTALFFLPPGSPPGLRPAPEVLPTVGSENRKQKAEGEGRAVSFGEVLLLFSAPGMLAEAGGCSPSSNYWRCSSLSPVLILHCVIALLFSFILLFSLIWQLPEKPEATQAVYFKIFKIC